MKKKYEYEQLLKRGFSDFKSFDPISKSCRLLLPRFFGF